MNNKSKLLVALLSVLFSTSCAGTSDRTLSPPSNTTWVNVEVKNPSPYTKPFPLEVVYISHICMKSSINGVDGSREEKPSYNGVKIPLQQQGNSDSWRAKVAMNGGGSCEWKLSEFNLGIEYIDATHLRKDLVPGTAVGATIAFDDIAAQDGRFESIHGDLNISPKYFPYIREWKLLKQENDLSLLGKEDFLSYRACGTTNVSFKPFIDEKKIVKYIEPERKTEDTYSKIVYPDGSIAPKRTLFPDFDKVDKMEFK